MTTHPSTDAATPTDRQTGMFRGKMRRVSPAGQPCSKEDERALKKIRRQREHLEATQILAIKQASANGASSYAIGEAVGVSHSHVQRILRGQYDHLLKADED
jgi:hypothetical protein